MKKHEDYVTHIDNSEDIIYLKTKHFPVNMRLFKTSLEYKNIILQQCSYIRERCLDTIEGYKKPHGMSSANLGLAHNIIGVAILRNKPGEHCKIMINPVIHNLLGEIVETPNRFFRRGNVAVRARPIAPHRLRLKSLFRHWRYPDRSKYSSRWFSPSLTLP